MEAAFLPGFRAMPATQPTLDRFLLTTVLPALWWAAPGARTPTGRRSWQLRADGVYDLRATTSPPWSALLEEADPAATVKALTGERLGSVEALLASSDPKGAAPRLGAYFLAPCDLQSSGGGVLRQQHAPGV